MVAGGSRSLASLPWLVLALSLGLTGVAAWYVGATTRQVEQSRFERTVLRREETLRDRLSAYRAMLRATAAVFARGEPDREWFRAYAEDLQLQERYRGLQAMGWIVRLGPDGVPAVEERVRDEGIDDYRVWPDAPSAAERSAVLLVEPVDRRNRVALGYDVLTEPVRRAGAERARDTGLPALTAPVNLIIDPAGQERGFGLFVPVYAGGANPTSVEERRAQLVGFVFAIFDSNDLFDAIFAETTPLVATAVYDEEVGPEHALRAAPPDPDHPDHEPRWRVVREIEMAGRTWVIEHTSRHAFEAEAPRPVPFVGIGGALLSAMLFGLVLTQQRATEAERRHREALAAADAALREEEQRFRALYERSPLSILVFSPDGRPLRSNTASERMWGASAASAGDYNVLRDPMLEEAGVMPLMRAAFAGSPRVLPTIRYRSYRGTSAGESLWVRAHVYPILGSAGEVLEVAVVQEDVSDRVRAEESLRDAQRLESVGVLAAGVAHDFNNLLAIVQGYAGLVASEAPSGSATRDHAEKVLAASARASDLTGQLLAYAGQGIVSMGRVDLAATIREMCDALRSSIPENITFTLDLPEAPLPVLGDDGQLKHLLAQVVVNAREALDDAPGHIVVTVRRVKLDDASAAALATAWPLSPGDYAELVVEDDGPGMDEATRRRIFDPFFTTKFLGRGLGLAAVLGIARRHFGGIVAESEPGRGTRIRVLLPMYAEERAVHEPIVKGPGSRTILVADDDAVILDAARDILTGRGHRVFGAKDGLAAAEIFRQHPEIDLVILDLNLPGMRGEEVYARMMAVRPEVPVVITSGYTAGDVLSRLGDPRRAAGFLPKPWTAKRLLEAVERGLQGGAP